MTLNLQGITNQPSTADAVDTVMERYDVLGYGAGRIVIVDPSDSEYVFKIGVGLEGHEQNENEVKVHQKTMGDDVHDRLLSVVDYDPSFSWIRFPRVTCDTDCPVSTKFCGPSAEYISKCLGENGIVMREIETTFVDGEAVAYDYGALKSINK